MSSCMLTEVRCKQHKAVSVTGPAAGNQSNDKEKSQTPNKLKKSTSFLKINLIDYIWFSFKIFGRKVSSFLILGAYSG